MRIGEIAKETGLNISNIRFYERKGLLTPAREQDSKYRDYTEEDVLRIKRILLYRKMGISIETIYLMMTSAEQTGESGTRDVLLRQRSLLEEEIENLTGSLKLCQLILDENEKELSSERVDHYLNFVYEEEEKGERFAEISELLEDITEYTRDGIFASNPIGVWFYKPWSSTVFAVLFWILIISVPALHLIDALMGRGELSIPLLVIYAIIIGLYGWGFVRFRRLKKKYMQTTAEEKDGE